MSCGVGCRRGSDHALLWLWRRPVATAPIQSLAWEPPYAAGAAQEIATTTTTKDKRQKKKKKKKKRILVGESSHCGAAEMNPTSIHEDEGSIPGLTQWVRDPALP